MAFPIELFLGLLGSITGLMGAIGLIIQILRYSREKPKLEVELKFAKHFYNSRGENQKNYFLHFSIESLVRNTGDRGTTVGYATLDFTIGKQNYTLTQDGPTERVHSNDILRLYLGFEFLSSYDTDPKQEEIPFKLILHHSHGDLKLEGISTIMV